MWKLEKHYEHYEPGATPTEVVRNVAFELVQGALIRTLTGPRETNILNVRSRTAQSYYASMFPRGLVATESGLLVDGEVVRLRENDLSTITAIPAAVCEELGNANWHLVHTEWTT